MKGSVGIGPQAPFNQLVLQLDNDRSQIRPPIQIVEFVGIVFHVVQFIAPGQAATVKFSAYDFSIYGGMDAEVENISPDTVVDERGNAFYLVRVRTKGAKFNDKLPIIPGMTAEVDILTGNKSVLAYLLKPVLKAKAYALRER